MPPFPHSGSVPCRCPYKERIVRQTTVDRTPNHQFVDGCRPPLPPRLWQPRNSEGGEATVIYVEGSLKFPNSYRVSQLDAVLRLRSGLSWFNWWISFAPEFQCDYFCESSCLYYLSSNSDFHVSKIMHS